MLNKTQLASIFRFIADVLTSTETPAVAEPATGEAAPAPKRKGRPPGSTNAAPPVVETPAEPEKPKLPEGAKTLDELRALIKPLILATRGEEVKAVLNKFAPKDHSGDYTLSLLSERPETHAEFVKEIEALLI